MRLRQRMIIATTLSIAFMAGSALAANSTKVLYHELATNTDGNANGKVTLVEFYDFRCGTCLEMTPVIKKVIQNEPQLRVVYREYPILGSESTYAAQAAVAAKMQDRYLALRNLMMSSNTPLSPQTIASLASKAQVDPTLLQKDMKSDYVKQQLEKNSMMADNWGVPGTPTFFIGKTDEQPTKLVGYQSAATLENIINQKLK